MLELNNAFSICILILLSVCWGLVIGVNRCVCRWYRIQFVFWRWRLVSALHPCCRQTTLSILWCRPLGRRPMTNLGECATWWQISSQRSSQRLVIFDFSCIGWELDWLHALRSFNFLCWLMAVIFLQPGTVLDFCHSGHCLMASGGSWVVTCCCNEMFRFTWTSVWGRLSITIVTKLLRDGRQNFPFVVNGFVVNLQLLVPDRMEIGYWVEIICELL